MLFLTMLVAGCMKCIARCNTPCNAMLKLFFPTLRDKLHKVLQRVTTPLYSQTTASSGFSIVAKRYVTRGKRYVACPHPASPHSRKIVVSEVSEMAFPTI
jgi:hypothetical protein